MTAVLNALPLIGQVEIRNRAGESGCVQDNGTFCFGWAADNVEEVEIVTADGQVRVANRDQHSDLFWAVRGGGGNYGVVSRFTFRLHEVGPTVYGGLIALAVRTGRGGDVGL